MLRLYVGWAWLDSGWEKLHGAAWTEKAGAAITGFVSEALKKTRGPHPDVRFLETAVLRHPVFWSYLAAD